MRPTGFTFVLLLLLVPSAFSREWTDSTGKFHVQAEFIDFDGAVVRLRTPEGTVRGCEWKRLSTADRDFVTRLVAPQKINVTANSGRVPPAALDHGIQADTNNQKLSARSVSASRNETGRDGEVRVASQANAVAPSSVGKRIFSGYHSTFQLYGGTGTGAYWFRGADGIRRHYLAKLTYHTTTSNGYLVYTSVNTEGGVFTWYFYDAECDICGCGPCTAVWFVIATGTPRFYENVYREIPN